MIEELWCINCGVVMKSLQYYYDKDFPYGDEKGGKVFSENGFNSIGELVFCPKCGNIKVAFQK